MRSESLVSPPKWAVATSYREGAIVAIAKHAEQEGLLNVLFAATPLGALSSLTRYIPHRYSKLQKLLNKRDYDFLPRPRVKHLATVNELAHVAIRNLVGGRLPVSSSLMYWVKEEFDQEVAKQIRRNTTTEIFIGMWGSSAKSFEAAGRGRLKVLNYVNSRPAEHNRLLSQHASLPASHHEMIPGQVSKKVEREMELADLILVPSRFVAKQMTEYKSKVSVIPYGVNARVFSNPAALTEPQSDHHSDAPQIVFVGQISHRKGISTLLKVANSMKSARFSLVGPLVSRPVLEEAPQNVTYKGHVGHSDVAGIMNKADIFVLPSFEDAYPLVTLEAMACGKSVVVSDNCGTAELISDGENGLIFEAGNVAQLRNCLERLINDPALRYRLGQNAQALVCRTQTWDTFAGRVASAIGSASLKN